MEGYRVEILTGRRRGQEDFIPELGAKADTRKDETPEPIEPPTVKEAAAAEKRTPEGDQRQQPVPGSLFDTTEGKTPDDQDSPRVAAAAATNRQVAADYAYARTSRSATPARTCWARPAIAPTPGGDWSRPRRTATPRIS